MAVLRRGVLLGIAGWALAVGAVRASPVYSSREQALARAFPPPATIERKTHFLTDAEREKASRAARARVESNLVVTYVGRTSKGILGTAYFDTHVVRTMPETLLLVVRPDGTLPHFLNEQSGLPGKFVNAGVNGLFPLALEGLVR
ncbi:MAG: hypothetical protein ABI610_01825, partial [Acidobacteriota bacterium]